MQVVVIATVLIATILGSISGIGGGVLIKPVMDAICNMETSQISFMSGTTVLVMTIASLLRSRNDSTRIDYRGIYLAIGGAIGGLLGKMVFSALVASVSSSYVSLVQNIIMVLLTGLVFVYVLKKSSIRLLDMKNKVFAVVCGLFLGIFSSFLGIGGGPINIMVLSYFFSMETKCAALTSLYIIFFSQTVSLLGNIVSKDIPDIDWILMAVMACCAVIGATIGRKLSRRMDDKMVDKLFMGLLVVIILISVYNCFRYAP